MQSREHKPLDFEQQYYSNEINLIVGCDEAGRGPLAGPVVAAAVILPRAYINKNINDSKQLSEKKREELFKEIKENAIAIGVGIVEAPKIDEINIYEASRLAMKLAIEDMHHKYDLVLTDCMPIKGLGVEVIPIVKGDAKAMCIAAASIIAKVTRDHIMEELDKIYPEYGFASHKGYGTKSHLEALKKHGAIKNIHRFSYKPVFEIENFIPLF